MNTNIINENINVDDYFLLLKNLSINEKLKLISKISDSIAKNQDEARFYHSFGKFHTSQTADEIIDGITASRHFSNKNIEL